MPSPYLCNPFADAFQQQTEVAMPGWEIGMLVIVAVLVGVIVSVGFGRPRTGRGQ